MDLIRSVTLFLLHCSRVDDVDDDDDDDDDDNDDDDGDGDDDNDLLYPGEDQSFMFDSLSCNHGGEQIYK